MHSRTIEHAENIAKVKSIIVLDLETQRMMQTSKDYVWLDIDMKKPRPHLRGDLIDEFAFEPFKVIRPRKLSPWFSNLPNPIRDVDALIEFVLSDPRISTRRNPELYCGLFLIGYDPYWREIDLNWTDGFTDQWSQANRAGSAFFNRRLGLAVAVTWDVKYGFREWWEDDSVNLVQELCNYRAIVGANLMNFDYCVLERYVPDVRKRLGFRTVDILAHARWGLFLEFIRSQLRKRNKRTSKSAVEQVAIRSRLCPADTFCRTNYELDPDFWHLIPGERKAAVPGRGVSLARIAKGTLNASKLGKGASAPALFAHGKYEELVAYCQQDVRLTRDIFLKGCEHGAVNVSGMKVSVRWKELVDRLNMLRRHSGTPLMPYCLDIQYDLTLDEPPFSPVEALFRLQRRT